MSVKQATAVGGILRARPVARKPRQWVRSIYSGALVGNVLQLERGVLRRATNAAGEIVSDTKDPRAGLITNIGDRLVVCGAELDAIAVVEVLRIEPGWRERLTVQVVCGAASGAVHVMSAKGLNPAQEKKRRAA